MTKNNKILIIVLVFLVVLLLLINRLTDPRERRVTYFDVDLDELYAVEISNMEDTVRVARTNDTWNLEKPFPFPVDRSRIRNFLEQVVPAQTSRNPVSVSESSHPRYSVNEQRGVLVSFLDAGNNLLDQAYMGRRDRAHYARRPESDEVYQLLGHIGMMISANFQPWRDVFIFNMPRGDIKSIDVQYARSSYTISDENTHWEYNSSEQSFTIPDGNRSVDLILQRFEEGIASMRFYDFVYDEYEHLFEDPELVLTIKRHDNRETELLWGFYRDEGEFLVKKDGNTDYLYLVDANIADKFTKAHQHFQQQ